MRKKNGPKDDLRKKMGATPIVFPVMFNITNVKKRMAPKKSRWNILVVMIVKASTSLMYLWHILFIAIVFIIAKLYREYLD